ncbi:MAG: 3-deoxy-7-phosphoheptulonate synthase [Candidatus Muiribacteriota bacterium]
MIIVLHKNASYDDKQRLINKIKELGLKPHVSEGIHRTIIGAVGDEKIFQSNPVDGMPGIEKIYQILKPFKLVSREFKKETTVVKIRGKKFGDGKFKLIAGPCSVESKNQILECASFLSQIGVSFLRGGAFKPRTSPYSFQGLGFEGLKYLKYASDKYDIPVVSEIIDLKDVSRCYDYIDIFQVGARNMQNYNLLIELGKQDKPVLLKRGMSSTIKEWLMAAEYIMLKGNSNIILCERGIRTFENYTRNTLDLSAVIAAKNETHLPVIVDPSHATGKKEMIPGLTLASKVVGADGAMVEIHPEPEKALSDGGQSLSFSEFSTMLKKVRKS